MPSYAVMQPTFLPWVGYFWLINKVDYFVYLDDVQLVKQSWQTRNRIVMHDAFHLISVPISSLRLGQKIKDTEISNFRGWQKKTARTLMQNYSRHPHGSDLNQLVEAFSEVEMAKLCDMNIFLIEFICERLKIKTQRSKSSDLGLISENRTSRLIEIGKIWSCEKYLSPLGSKDYLESDGYDGMTKVPIEYVEYHPIPYNQSNSSQFISHASVVDLIANVGWVRARDFIVGQ